MVEDVKDYVKDCKVVDARTGEVVDTSKFVQAFVEMQNEEYKKGFQLVYPEMLAAYMKCSSSAPVDVLLYLLDNKSYNNIVAVTNQMIIEGTGVSKNTVTKIMSTLQKQDLLRKLRNGVYMLNPSIMIRGGNARWAATDAWRNGGTKNV